MIFIFYDTPTFNVIAILGGIMASQAGLTLAITEGQDQYGIRFCSKGGAAWVGLHSQLAREVANLNTRIIRSLAIFLHSL